MPTGTPSSEPAGAPARADASLYLHPQTLARLGSLELRAKIIVEGVMSGQHRSPYKGSSVEFAQHRPYAPGDDIRRLDWKVYARTDKLQVKQQQQETNLDLYILVDASGSMRFGSRTFAEASGEGAKAALDGRSNWSKFDHATAVAAALAYIALQQGDRVGVGVFANELTRWQRPSSAPGTWRRIVNLLATSPIDKPTSLARTIEQVLIQAPHRGLVVLISDLFQDIDDVRQALARLRFRGHDAVVAQVLDRRERDFDLDGEVPLLGLEGEGEIKVDARAIRSAYLQAIGAHREQVEKAARATGFDFMSIDTHDWLGPPLSGFLAAREARLKRRG
jgi:uncharacterized protein (DUF58 family)